MQQLKQRVFENLGTTNWKIVEKYLTEWKVVVAILDCRADNDGDCDNDSVRMLMTTMILYPQKLSQFYKMWIIKTAVPCSNFGVTVMVYFVNRIGIS